MDILLNNDRTSLDFGDALFVNGTLSPAGITQESAEVVAQRLSIRLNTYLGEWFLDVGYGVPYYQQILAKKTTKVAVDRIFQQQILSERGVRELVSFSSTFQNRRYEMSFVVRVLDGSLTETISINTNL